MSRALFLLVCSYAYLPCCSALQAQQPDAGEKADSKVLAGHSYHGEVFNEGPRQKAYLMEGTGNVSFPATCKSEEVQKFVNQGVGQLHGFWVFEAERSFRQAISLDRDCAIAYWGAAKANLSNEKRSKGFIEKAVKLKDKVTERELMYITALDAYIKAGKAKKKQRDEAYTKALDEILLKFPKDLEAKAFLALHLYKTRSAATSYHSVDALIQQIFAVEPHHPAHHFRIHLWDHKRAEVALSSAAVCGKAAPGIAHMWHMPGHIYSRLKRYEDAVWQQEASARVDHAHMMRDRVLPDQIHNFAHNNEWLIRNLVHVGRVHDALDLAKNMIELPRHPKYNTLSKRGSTKYGRMRLFEVLSKYELWDEMIDLCNTSYLEPTDSETEQIKRLRYLGMALCQAGQVEKVSGLLTEVESRLAKEKAAQEKAGNAAAEEATKEKKDKKQIDKAKVAARKKFDTKIRNLEKTLNALKGHQAWANKEFKQAFDLLKKAGEDRLRLATVQWLAGERDPAITSVQGLVKSGKNQARPLAVLADMLWRSDKKDEAKKAFNQLREISGPIDIESSVFARLQPIAKELKLPEDWRVQKPRPKDFGERPELDSLGSFRWQPSPAPAWTLHDQSGNPRSLKQYEGKPVVVIFYLGYGCLHCVEQLQAFAPMAKEFEEAGISMVAVSSDDHDGLKESVKNYESDAIPIPLVANSELDVFKAYRAYDDFEQQPLHGTFLIDGKGMVRWQDISYEPFMDAKFVLKEARRLLNQQQ
ncbi:MAG: redoxin domain-containing protein [Planctomycetes bacterium]|nr:redoxin domain-containing protein [Planctomycetota bacterium]